MFLFKGYRDISTWILKKISSNPRDLWGLGLDWWRREKPGTRKSTTAPAGDRPDFGSETRSNSAGDFGEGWQQMGKSWLTTLPPITMEVENNPLGD